MGKIFFKIFTKENIDAAIGVALNLFAVVFPTGEDFSKKFCCSL